MDAVFAVGTTAMNEKPLSKETIVDAKLYINNPDWTDRYSIALWVEHTEGVEFPVIDSGGLTKYMSASTEYADSDPVELSDEFYDELSMWAMKPSSRMSVMVPLKVPEKMSVPEKWILECINNISNERKIPFEIEWLIEEAHKRSL